MQDPFFLQYKALSFMHGRKALRHLRMTGAMHKRLDVPKGETKNKQEKKTKRGRGKPMYGGEPTTEEV